MFVVYWLENMDANPAPSYKCFGDEEMSEALALMEELRTAQRNAERKVAFITMSSENPQAVGKLGVSSPGPDYAWTKRRGNTPRAKRDLKPEDYLDH